ncbi:MAG: MFS transporter [Phenylobacterium sp.]
MDAAAKLAETDEPRSGRDWTPYSIYALAFLTLISSLNYLDRSILGLALPKIKAEMHVSDLVLGLVSGLLFAAFYSLMGIPVAWLADRWNRRNIIAIGLFFWSLMTLATGFVANIWQLAACRLLMGAGEAAGLAPSNSLLSDLFRKARRPLALAILAIASSISSILYFPIIGRIGDAHGWRAMFVAAGLPGVVLALIFMLTVKEPPRTGASGEATRLPAPPLGVAIRFLAGSRAYLLMLLGVMLMGANLWSASAWNPSFLARVHHMTMTQVADVLGPIRGVLGAAGILLGGVLIDRMGKRDPRWRLRIPAIACLLAGPAELMFLMGDNKAVWFTGLAGATLFSLVHQPPVYAAAMNVAQPRLRALAVALILMVAGLFGQVVGPAMVGFLNDQLAPAFGPMAIRYSMLIIAVTPVLAAAAFWAASAFVETDGLRAEQADGARG